MLIMPSLQETSKAGALKFQRSSFSMASHSAFVPAKSILVKLITKYPNSYLGHQMLGKIYEYEGGMRRAIDETERRRKIQDEYNKTHNVTPKTIKKPVARLIEKNLIEIPKLKTKDKLDSVVKQLSKSERRSLVQTLTNEMKQASKNLEFERAATLRDMILELDGTLPKLTRKGS